MSDIDQARARLVQQWMAKGREDLELARYLLQSEMPFNAAIGFHAQQAAEKYLKALLTEQQIEFSKTHNLTHLLRQLETTMPALVAQLADAEILTAYAVESRYPGDLPELTSSETMRAVELADEVACAVMQACQVQHSD